MKTREFFRWLEVTRHYKENTASSRVANCHTIERNYGSLDELHATNRLGGLIEEFRYSTEDERRRRTQRHKVPIDGNIRTGSATLKSALVLYKSFLESVAAAGITASPRATKHDSRLGLPTNT